MTQRCHFQSLLLPISPATVHSIYSSVRTTLRTKRSGFDLLTTRGGRHTCLEWRENHTSNWFWLSRCEHVLWNHSERTDVLKTDALKNKIHDLVSSAHTNTFFLLRMCDTQIASLHAAAVRAVIVARLAALSLSVYLCVECVYPPFVHSCLAAVTRASLSPPILVLLGRWKDLLSSTGPGGDLLNDSF